MLTKEQKESIASEILLMNIFGSLNTERDFSLAEMDHTIDNIENILESTLSWIDGAIYREMYDFTDIEARKKLGLEILSMIIKERMKNGADR